MALATPNYSYEKRQRELAKKRKAEEKRQKKNQRDDGSPGQSEDPSDNQPDTAQTNPGGPMPAPPAI